MKENKYEMHSLKLNNKITVAKSISFKMNFTKYTRKLWRKEGRWVKSAARELSEKKRLRDEILING